MLPRWIMIILLFASCRLIAKGQSLSREQQNVLVMEARQHFQEGNALLSDSREEATSRYRQALLRYHRLIREGGIENHLIYYNIGNIYLMQDDVGRAILNYKRALQFNRHDENLQKNLAYARLQCRDQFGEQIQRRVLQTLFFWHYDLSLWSKFIIVLIIWNVLCLVGATGLILRQLGRVRLGLILIAMSGAALMASFAIQWQQQYTASEGVIVASLTTARQGDGLNYPESFDQPLHAGVEFELLEERSQWWRVRLPDGTDTWIPSDAGEKVF